MAVRGGAERGHVRLGRVQLLRLVRAHDAHLGLYKKGIEFKLAGNEDYNTACSLLVISKNSCSKLHGQKVLI